MYFPETRQPDIWLYFQTKVLILHEFIRDLHCVLFITANFFHCLGKVSSLKKSSELHEDLCHFEY